MSKQGRESTTSFHCERFNRHARLSQCLRGDKAMPRPRVVKKVVLSKKINTSVSENRKSYSAGIISPKPEVSQRKKITKSDFGLDSNKSLGSLDYCKECGDVNTSKDGAKRCNDKLNSLLNVSSVHKIIHSKPSKQDLKNGTLKQYYKNENFQQSSESIPDMCNTKKPSLDTIKEQSEKLSTSKDSTFKFISDSEELGLFDYDDTDNIKNIKDFRSENFFECHSAKSRINHNIASDKNHKCVYRFYLNDRLFPVPLNTDFNENIRCMECNLPLRNTDDISSINGMIQVKVKLNNIIQDSLVMLPVKEPLIIKERKKDMQASKDFDSVYFGIIKLNLNGDSIFNSTLPDNSLALKYQKGFKKFGEDLKYRYSNGDNDDIIII